MAEKGSSFVRNGNAPVNEQKTLLERRLIVETDGTVRRPAKRSVMTPTDERKLREEVQANFDRIHKICDGR